LTNRHLFLISNIPWLLLKCHVTQSSIAEYLVSSLIGFIVLRHITDEIISFSNRSKKLYQDTSDKDITEKHNELKTISKTFQKLVEELEENTVSLGKRISELSALSELTVITSKMSNLNELFEIVLDNIIPTTDSRCGMMLSITDENKKMKIEAIRGIDRALIRENEIDVNATISGRVL